jgi:CBS domain-containing protein
MHHGVISTPPQTQLSDVAAQMAENDVHCVVVEGLARTRGDQEALVWGILSDLDLVRAIAARRLDSNAGEFAATEIVTVESTGNVEDVAPLMAEHECTHLIVVSPQSGDPVGVVSSLDVERALARPGTASS